MKCRYRNPPILEAVCEIHFESALLLSPEQVLSIGPIWKQAYPNQQIIEEKNIEFQLNLESANVQTHDRGKKLLARSEDGTRIAQHSAQFLAVNQLKPYQGWSESFQSDILARLAESVELFKFERIRMVNLRYIDRLDFPQRPIVWGDWLAVGLPIPSSIPAIGGQFQSHYQQQLEPGIGVLANLVTLPQENAEQTSILFDTIVAWQGSESLSADPF
jgi:uncharacterized protein (TIGR04255 family)